MIEINEAAFREGRNRKYDIENLKNTLDPGEIFLVTRTFYHAKNDIRVAVLIDNKTYYFDMSIARYDSLPNIWYVGDKMHMEELDEAAERRPYKEKREWTESTVKRPLRSPSFAIRVKNAYDYRCAICNISNPVLLIATHIRPVSEFGTDETNNGICLCQNHDILYENGVIRIDVDGSKEYKGIKKGKVNFPENKEDWPSQENLIYRKEGFECKGN